MKYFNWITLPLTALAIPWAYIDATSVSQIPSWVKYSLLGLVLYGVIAAILARHNWRP